ncbi:Velvet factor [Geosmithia morbida]|uniref:Velvet factor n=1 Tax=Geosmithia morbida TaxID=1094350 RepID=A0A9P4YYI7_9HYPO|nr:Velvet factor [Geosmithia morbida]KAF4123344.1 Velvet factor [Geosmithia morbida]
MSQHMTMAPPATTPYQQTHPPTLPPPGPGPPPLAHPHTPTHHHTVHPTLPPPHPHLHAHAPPTSLDPYQQQHHHPPPAHMQPPHLAAARPPPPLHPTHPPPQHHHHPLHHHHPHASPHRSPPGPEDGGPVRQVVATTDLAQAQHRQPTPVSHHEPATGRRYQDIDYSRFVLQVDLWDEHGTQEINLCRNNSSASGPPASSASSSYSYSPLAGSEARYPPPQQQQQQQQQPPPPGQQALPPSRDMTYGQSSPMGYSQQPDYQYSQVTTPSYTPPSTTYGPPQQYFPAHQATARYDAGPPPQVSYMDSPGPMVSYVNDHKTPWSRNLIGSVAASAFCLVDTRGREGIWFVLQDLSVRLEGKYKLKFSFVNISRPGPGTGLRDRPATMINRGRTPILASCFSESFQVFSAKKFPGVCESTPLSKTFAGQGIKIPIRKDGGKGGEDDDD